MHQSCAASEFVELFGFVLQTDLLMVLEIDHVSDELDTEFRKHTFRIPFEKRKHDIKVFCFIKIYRCDLFMMPNSIRGDFVLASWPRNAHGYMAEGSSPAVLSKTSTNTFNYNVYWRSGKLQCIQQGKRGSIK